MKKFHNIQNNIIPKLKKRKKKGKKKLLKLKKIILKKLNIEDEIDELQKKISNNKNKKKNYLLDNSNIIFEYFEKKKICLKE